VNELILVVEDNDITRKMVRLTLEVAGYRVLQAASAKEAIEQFSRETPQLVLQDLVLPDLSGFELVQGEDVDRSFQITHACVEPSPLTQQVLGEEAAWCILRAAFERRERSGCSCKTAQADTRTCRAVLCIGECELESRILGHGRERLAADQRLLIAAAHYKQ
jgi:hypothetical protein